MTTSALLDADDPAWTEALTSVQHDTYHRPEYVTLDAPSLDGRPAAFLHREGADTLLVPLVLREIDGTSWRDATSPYGYPGPISNVEDVDSPFWDRARDAFLATLAQAQVVSCFLRLNPLLPVPQRFFDGLGTVVSHGPTIAVDLTRPADVRWSDTRSNHRRHINRARREGITTVVDDWSLLPDMVAAYDETMVRVGAVPFYFFGLTYFEALRTRLAENVHLMVATQEGAVVAGLIAFECDGIVQYHLGGTLNAALDRQPMKLLLTDTAAWGESRGNRVLHLGGGVGGSDDPLLHFKTGFSDWQLPFATVRAVIDVDAYRELAADRAPSIDPADLSAFFPAYRAVVAP